MARANSGERDTKEDRGWAEQMGSSHLTAEESLLSHFRRELNRRPPEEPGATAELLPETSPGEIQLEPAEEGLVLIGAEAGDVYYLTNKRLVVISDQISEIVCREICGFSWPYVFSAIFPGELEVYLRDGSEATLIGKDIGWPYAPMTNFLTRLPGKIFLPEEWPTQTRAIEKWIDAFGWYYY